MAKLIDLTGQRFGLLTVEKRDYSHSKGTYWECTCDCGNKIITRGDQLKRGKTSCGCDLKEKNSKAHLKDETGHVYGYLTVLYRTDDLRKGEARWHCSCKCGKETDVSGIHLRNGSVKSCGCLITEKNQSKKIQEIGNKYGLLTVIEEAERPEKDPTHLYWRCKCECGNDNFIVSGVYLRNGISTHCGCLSISSKGENEIKNILENNNINFIQEYSFNDLIDKEPLRFDFAILNNDNSLKYLIEFDGIQHFKSIEFFGGQERLESQQKRDKMKNDYCKKNNIKLIRIRYDEEITENKIIF